MADLTLKRGQIRSSVEIRNRFGGTSEANDKAAPDGLVQNSDRTLPAWPALLPRMNDAVSLNFACYRLYCLPDDTHLLSSGTPKLVARR